MDKWQTIHELWSGFGLPAYDENSVPDDAEMPYITYSASVGDFERPVVLTASVWYRSTSWAGISQMVDHIAQAVNPYVLMAVDGGYLYVVKGSPFAQRMSDQDDTVKRVYLVMNAEFYTNY